MQGKVVVLTGGTSGIGEAAAVKLAGLGARLVLVARDASRAEVTLKRLEKISPRSGQAPVHSAHLADLSLVAEARRVAREIAATEPRIDVLINNAGLICARRQVTAEGYELTFATNHLAYFVLTHGLLAPLLASAPARIVNTASDVHCGAKLDFDDLQSQHGYISLPVNSPGAYPAAASPPTACIPALSPAVSAFRVKDKREIRPLPAFSPPTASRRRKALKPSFTWLRRRTWRRQAASISTSAGPSRHPKRRRIGLWLRSYGRNRNGWGEPNTK